MFWQILTLALCLTLGSTMQDPAKRATANDVVEIYFVVDRKAVQIYEAESTESTAAAKLADAKARLTKDIDYFLTQVNVLYNSLKGYDSYSVNVQIATRKLVILDTNIFAAGNIKDNKDVLDTYALNTFENYLQNEGAYSALKYDLALLFTGFDLYDSSNNKAPAGLANVGTVCRGEKAASVVELDGTYQSVVTAAHEIGHNLGASHDPASTGYIMAPVSKAGSDDRWNFSLLSASDIGAVVKGLSNNCLQTDNAASVIPNTAIPDDLKDANTICKRSTQSQNSYMCQGFNMYNNGPPKGDAVCKIIYCNVGGKSCQSAFSSDGLVCGIGKSCKLGKCVADSSVVNPNADENCLFGDEGYLNFDTGTYTCEGFLNDQKYQCSSDSIYRSCCATCNSLKTGIQGCMYGDLDKQCQNYPPSSSFCSVNGHICCYLCKDFNSGKRSAGQDDGGDVPVLHGDPKLNVVPKSVAPDYRKSSDDTIKQMN